MSTIPTFEGLFYMFCICGVMMLVFGGLLHVIIQAFEGKSPPTDKERISELEKKVEELEKKNKINQ